MFEEVIEDIKDGFSDAKKGNGLSFLIIGFVVVFVIVLLKDNSDDAEVVYQYSSYPSVDKNADVIIDSLYDSLQYSQAELEEKIDENFVATQDYINEGFTKQQDLMNKVYNDTMQSFDDLTVQVDKVNTNVSNVGTKVDSVNTNVNNLGSTLSSAIANVQSSVNSVASSVNKVQSTVNSNTTTLNKVVSNTTSTSTSTTKTNTSASKTSTSTIKATSYKGNSIVDGLKSVGVNSSYSYRSQLAAANGIKNYTGSASQNTALLNMLKQGTLKKA